MSWKRKALGDQTAAHTDEQTPTCTHHKLLRKNTGKPLHNEMMAATVLDRCISLPGPRSLVWGGPV